MIKYVEVVQRTKQYRLPTHLEFLSYDNMTFDELKNKIITEHNESIKNEKFKCDNVIFEEIEPICGIII